MYIESRILDSGNRLERTCESGEEEDRRNPIKGLEGKGLVLASEFLKMVSGNLKS